MDLHGYTPARKSCSLHPLTESRPIGRSLRFISPNAVPPRCGTAMPFAALAILCRSPVVTIWYRNYATGAK
ncbi:hypothetical protein KCP75_20825 [Salmonella enterica subsp. enterica]|nr:hypothetical protein KCP75_20825 [Salmonella enterica subsp. enterica]